ncbi:MAG: hypothetical protein K2W96_25995 [Gemmataceae bacterium]|nr:hypothetical protein [Gemmataceae bacterium]
MTSGDPVLTALARDIGLEWPAGLEEWEDRVRSMLDPEDDAQYMEARMGFGHGPGDAASNQ